MPDHAAAPVAFVVVFAERGLEAREHAGARLAQSPELVVARDLLDDLAALVFLEGDAGAQVVHQRTRLEQTADQRLQRRRTAAVVAQRSPGHEAAAPAGDRTDSGQQAVRDGQQDVRHEEVGRGVRVATELFDGDAEIGLRVGGVLQLDDRNGQPVQEHREVRADHLARRGCHAELAHHQQLVSGRVVKVDEPCASAAGLAALGVAILDLNAVGELGMEPSVVLGQCEMRRARQDAHDLLDGVVRQLGVEAMQCCGEAAFEQHIGSTAAFTRVVDLDAALDDCADGVEVNGRDVLDELFGGRGGCHVPPSGVSLSCEGASRASRNSSAIS